MGCKYEDTPIGWQVSQVWDPLLEAHPERQQLEGRSEQRVSRSVGAEESNTSTPSNSSPQQTRQIALQYNPDAREYDWELKKRNGWQQAKWGKYTKKQNEVISAYVDRMTRGVLKDDEVPEIFIGGTVYTIHHEEDTKQLVQINTNTGFKRRVRLHTEPSQQTQLLFPKQNAGARAYECELKKRNGSQKAKWVKYEDKYNDVISAYVDRMTSGVSEHDEALEIFIEERGYTIHYEEGTKQFVQINMDTGFKRRVRRHQTLQ